MDKEIRFSQHSLLKIEVLAEHDINISQEYIIDVINSPDQVESSNRGKITAQKRINGLVLRVIYQEYPSFIIVITVYPGRSSRYEKN
jgi:hypothetical protein